MRGGETRVPTATARGLIVAVHESAWPEAEMHDQPEHFRSLGFDRTMLASAIFDATDPEQISAPVQILVG
jgi:hypothetical protein